MFCFNPVDTRCCFNVYSTSVWRQIDVETTSCVYREEDLFCVIGRLGKPSWFAPKSKRSPKFNPLKVHQLSPYSCLVCRHGFPWKGYNFHRLKDIFREYSIKRMKELLFWLLYPIGYGSTTKIVYILKIYTTWIATNIKYHIRLLLTLLSYKHNIAVN